MTNKNTKDSRTRFRFPYFHHTAKEEGVKMERMFNKKIEKAQEELEKEKKKRAEEIRKGKEIVDFLKDTAERTGLKDYLIKLKEINESHKIRTGYQPPNGVTIKLGINSYLKFKNCNDCKDSLQIYFSLEGPPYEDYYELNEKGIYQGTYAQDLKKYKSNISRRITSSIDQFKQEVLNELEKIVNE